MPAVIPTLSRFRPYLSSRSEIGSYLVNYFLLNPGRISSFTENYQISFRNLASKYGHTPEILKNELEKALKSTLQRYFTEDTIQVTTEVSAYTTEQDPRYKVAFSILFYKPGVDENLNVEPAVIKGDFTVHPDNSIELTYL